jgi:tRNA U34 5-carboxymethylaminomethyl modifying GTPase MnmE/TrmE
MEGVDFCKQKGYSVDVFLSFLNHDNGKSITKKEILPNHRGHEMRSFEINKQYVKQHRFTSKQEEMICTFARQHMKFHFIEQMTATKLIRFYRSIKKYADEYFQCANCDTPLNQKQLAILELIKQAIKDTKIEVPRGCKDPASFVEEKYAHTLRELLNAKT